MAEAAALALLGTGESGEEERLVAPPDHEPDVGSFKQSGGGIGVQIGCPDRPQPQGTLDGHGGEVFERQIAPPGEDHAVLNVDLPVFDGKLPEEPHDPAKA